MSSKLKALLAVPLFLGSFAATYVVLAPSGGARVHETLAAVAADRAHTVCLGARPCLDPGAEYTLFVLFTRRDCAIGLYQTAVLDQLRALPRSRLNVVGVAYGLDRPAAERFARASGIGYPVYLEPRPVEKLLGRLRPEGSNRPVAVLVNRQGTVLYRGRAGGTVQAHLAAMRRVAAVVEGRTR